jgi:hypothetical protein
VATAQSPSVFIGDAPDVRTRNVRLGLQRRCSSQCIAVGFWRSDGRASPVPTLIVGAGTSAG